MDRRERTATAMEAAMGIRSVPSTELEYLLDVEHALADVVKPPPSLASPGVHEVDSVQRALTALERAGMRAGRRESLVRALRVLGIRRPCKFALGLRGDYRLANWPRTARRGTKATYLVSDDFESVALLLQTILHHRPDRSRQELNIAAILLADKWLEAAGYELPAEGPPVLHIAAFHSGGPAIERADALRQLVAWAQPRQAQAASPYRGLAEDQCGKETPPGPRKRPRRPAASTEAQGPSTDPHT